MLLVLMLMSLLAPAQEKPAEEERFDSAAFHRGLRRRGLTELLELHLKEFPPRNAESLLTLKRQVKLATYADVMLPEEVRRAALEDANDRLEELIAVRRIDPRRHQWRFDLARSLIHEESSPFISHIVLLGGNAEDRRQLKLRTTRAIAILDTLREQITAEFERVDALPLREYEKIDRTGYVDRLETLEGQSDYLALWSMYYDALAREATDPARTAKLKSMLARMDEASWLLETPHEQSHVQVQATLLSGMALRLLGRFDEAEARLADAIRIGRKVSDADERDSLAWTALWGSVERARALRRGGRPKEAIAALHQYGQRIPGTTHDNFGVRLVLALAERAVHKAEAKGARRRGDPTESQAHQARALGVLLRLAKNDPRNRDEIYGTLYDLMGPQADPAQLDAIERAAMMAGLLYDAGQLEQQASSDRFEPARQATAAANAQLDRVIAIGDAFINKPPAGGDELMPEIIFNLAVARQRRGFIAESARHFLRVAQDYPAFAHAPRAAVLAVQIAHELRFDEAGTQHRAVVEALYLDALATLVTQFGAEPSARYWRFFYGQALDDNGQHRKAADHYLLVDPKHERALEAKCFRARSLAAALAQPAGHQSDSQVAVRRQAEEVFDLLREFSSEATQALGTASDVRRGELEALRAEAKLVAARTHLLPQVGRPRRALEVLAGFEESYPKAKGVVGRVLSVRLRALIQLERFEEAADVLPGYVKADPSGAPATLQSLYLGVFEEVVRLKNSGRDSRGDDTKKKTVLALKLARQIYDWGVEQSKVSGSSDHTGAPFFGQRRVGNGSLDLDALKLQLGEALLLNDQPAQAYVLFQELTQVASSRTTLATDGQPSDKPAKSIESVSNARVLMGLAQSLLDLGKPAEALPLFNKLAMSLPMDQPMRWRALLRDLQCRYQLEHDPNGIIKAILNQQANRHLKDPNSGGTVANDLERLLRDCRRLAESSPASPSSP